MYIIGTIQMKQHYTDTKTIKLKYVMEIERE